MATDVIARLCGLQTANPYRLRIYFAAHVWDAGGIEALVLHELREHRLLGEWVSVGPRQAAKVIERHATASGKWQRWSPSAKQIKQRDALLLGKSDPLIAEGEREKLAIDELKYLTEIT